MTPFRRLRMKFSSSAPRLTVRPHMQWYLRWGMVMPFVLLAALLIWWAYDSGLELAGFHRIQAEEELGRLNQLIEKLQVANAELSSQVVAYERQVQMEHASNAELERQLRNVSDEKMHLNEDLAFFQNLTQSGSREEKLSIHRVTITRDTLPGEFHCSMLLVQSGQRPKEFRGYMRIVVNVQHNDRREVVLFPLENAPDTSAYDLNFKYYQRVERSFRLPPDMQLEAVQIRIYEHGESEPKIKQDVALS